LRCTLQVRGKTLPRGKIMEKGEVGEVDVVMLISMLESHMEIMVRHHGTFRVHYLPPELTSVPLPAAFCMTRPKIPFLRDTSSPTTYLMGVKHTRFVAGNRWTCPSKRFYGAA